MKLSDLIDALAEEVDIMQPYLEQTLEDMLLMDVKDKNFADVLEQYNDYANRMGEASEMVGFDGLRVVCEQVQKNTLLLAVSDDEHSQINRESLIDFLRKWPKLMSMFLHDLSDPSIAAGLVDICRTAPDPLSEEQSLKVMHQLGAMVEHANEGANYIDIDNQRPLVATLDDVTLDLPDDINEQLLEGFLQESPDMALKVVSWAQSLSSMTANQSINQEEIITVKRCVHTLKGTGATIGLQGLASVGHHFEDLLEYLESNPKKLFDNVKNIILDSAYCMEQMVGYIAGIDDYPEQSLMVLQNVLNLANLIDRGESLDLTSASLVSHSESASKNNMLDSSDYQEADYQSENYLTNSSELNVSQSNIHVENLDIMSDNTTSNTTLSNYSTADEGFSTQTKSQRAEKEQIKNSIKTTKSSSLRVPIERIDDLFRVSGEISVHSSAMESKINELTNQAKGLLEQNLRVQKRLFELETLVDIRALSTMNRRSGKKTDIEDGLDPLEMEQYNELHSSAHALVEEAADSRVIAQQVEDGLAKLTSLQTRQQVLSRDLQHLVIGTRMAEVGTLESRLQRNVRMTSQTTGKVANLFMNGKDTLIDSDVLNQLAEPLLHLLRNAVDHGIELPEEREEKNKEVTGNIYLDFSRQGQQVILRCEDDGQGLNLQKIFQRALEKGLITERQELSDDEIARLILASGFSSQDTVSEISGRGVGLDVVREWVNSMKGTINISNSVYGGCLFELRFAASLSTIQSLIVSASDTLYALPAIQIEQAVPRSVGRFEHFNGLLNFTYNNQVIPAKFLATLTGMSIDAEQPLADYDAVLVVIENQRYALAVDKLIDSRELLVKSPDRYSRHILGISGLSILGNGSVVVNLDLSQIIDLKQARNTNKKIASDKTSKNIAKVLVVDDALTVRNSLKQLIEDMGYQVKTARDGIDAIETLNTFHPEVVLTDLEMPNLNGIELTKHIRNRDGMSEMPIVMITSRSQDKHRNLADEAGVNHYFTKPYQDIQLIKVIREYGNQP